ncbi:type III secretion system export apparatus subunit SctT [Lacisediminimonas sp.]|uniref:type III secretion system export apparatus subunit SctT n=1 Tax=Lacisediminimonas sp. TaxID=3060582 RepID=UPI002715972D|nr:type III secretion system export apparatus subunit SctT [Lacisediminimonas sp.]MDO8301089.1 type III secretion system export apparatus subunit SctT [Lacisediminimonas sp.]
MSVSTMEWALPQIAAFTYTLPRLLAIFSVLPMFSRQALPGLMRMGVAGALGLFLVPSMLEPTMSESRTVIVIIGLALKEGLIGFAMGFLFALPLWAFEAMGALIDNQRGASVADTINPLTGHDTSPLGDLYSQAMLVYMIVTGAFMLILGGIYDSYVIWPVFSWWPQMQDGTAALILAQFDRMFRLAVLYGAPVILVMFLAEMGLALVSRFAPQLQVFFLAMPVKSGLAIFMFAIYTGLLFEYAGDLFLDIGNDVLRTMGSVLRPAAK